MTDAIIEELRYYRDEHAKQYDYDLTKITAALIKNQTDRGLPLEPSKSKTDQMPPLNDTAQQR